MTRAREWRLVRLPDGAPRESDFVLEEVELPSLQDGQVRIRNLWMSVDPYMRLPMSGQPGLHAPLAPGSALDGAAVGEVVESRDPAVSPGTFVWGMDVGWRDEAVTSARSVVPVDPDLAPLPAYLGLLGLTGITAWGGVEGILRPREGECLFVTGAAGAVGSVVVQLAKARGARVIGSTGSAEKARWLRETIGADAVVDYRREDLRARLGELAPEGFGLAFDNVGGSQLEATLDHMKPGGRIVLCGMIEQYDSSNYRKGPRNLFAAIEKGLTLHGLNAGFFFGRREEILRDLAGRLRDGSIVAEETVVDGLENATKAFLGVLRGENRGKMLVRVADERGERGRS